MIEPPQRAGGQRAGGTGNHRTAVGMGFAGDRQGRCPRGGLRSGAASQPGAGGTGFAGDRAPRSARR